MFTGIIQSVGTIESRNIVDNNYTYVIKTNFKEMGDVELGDSIAVNGVCLTVTVIEEDKINVDLSRETIDVTNAISWDVGSKLNLEKSLTLKDKLGGHMVSGHVDALARCARIEESGTSVIYDFEIPQNLTKFVVKKGSVALNGVSLTVNEISGKIFSVNLIPHTLEWTNLSSLSLGDNVNFEIDTIARYVEKMMQGFQNGQG